MSIELYGQIPSIHLAQELLCKIDHLPPVPIPEQKLVKLNALKLRFETLGPATPVQAFGYAEKRRKELAFPEYISLSYVADQKWISNQLIFKIYAKSIEFFIHENKEKKSPYHLTNAQIWSLCPENISLTFDPFFLKVLLLTCDNPNINKTIPSNYCLHVHEYGASRSVQDKIATILSKSLDSDNLSVKQQEELKTYQKLNRFSEARECFNVYYMCVKNAELKPIENMQS